MLPPGLGILGVEPPGAAAAASHGGSPRHFWDWEPIMRENRIGLFPYTPATLMLFGLREALRMLVDEEGLENVYARHQRLADGVRAAVARLGAADGVRAARERVEHDHRGAHAGGRRQQRADCKHAREKYGLSLGGGIGELSGVAFRIGHLGSLNELEVLGTLGGAELAFADLGRRLRAGLRRAGAPGQPARPRCSRYGAPG